MSESSLAHATGGLRRRWLFILAGFVAGAVTLIRAIGGAANDLPRIVEPLGEAPIAGVVYINWHALSLVFAALTVGLFVSVRLARPAARTVGVLAAVVFGATGLLFMYFSQIHTGSVFTFAPWIPLTATALLAAAAAWRA